jgi:hypothetical protein
MRWFKRKRQLTEKDRRVLALLDEFAGKNDLPSPAITNAVRQAIYAATEEPIAVCISRTDFEEVTQYLRAGFVQAHREPPEPLLPKAGPGYPLVEDLYLTAGEVQLVFA